MMNDLIESGTGCMQPGMEIGDHTIMGYLGCGALGETYLALGKSGREDTILRLLDFRSNSPEVLEQRLGDLHAGLEQVKNRKVLRIHAAEIDEFFLWVAEDRYEEPTLRAALRKRLAAGEGPFSEKDVRKIVFQILVGLHAIHTAGTVHGSLKPSHCTLSEDLKVRLVDPGLYPLVYYPTGEPGQRPSVSEEIPELPGFTPGLASTLETFTFSAPEVAEKNAYSPQADLYSTGYLAWHLLTGLDRAGAHFFQALQDPIMETWGSWFLQALAPNPVDRFQSAEDMLANLPGVKAVG